MSTQAIAIAEIKIQEAAEGAVDRDVQRLQFLTDVELQHVGGGAVIISAD